MGVKLIRDDTLRIEVFGNGFNRGTQKLLHHCDVGDCTRSARFRITVLGWPLSLEPQAIYKGGVYCEGHKKEVERVWANALTDWADPENEPGIPEHVHGTQNGYTNYGCRCEPCRDAVLEYQRKRRKRRVAA